MAQYSAAQERILCGKNGRVVGTRCTVGPMQVERALLRVLALAPSGLPSPLLCPPTASFRGLHYCVRSTLWPKRQPASAALDSVPAMMWRGDALGLHAWPSLVRGSAYPYVCTHSFLCQRVPARSDGSCPGAAVMRLGTLAVKDRASPPTDTVRVLGAAGWLTAEERHKTAAELSLMCRRRRSLGDNPPPKHMPFSSVRDVPNRHRRYICIV
ncbi:hypothetical protein VTG60DRAFT_1971 [Thermothelomyces hinnuleus]